MKVKIRIFIITYFLFSITVVFAQPDWKVVPGLYENSMNITGVIIMNSTESVNADNIVGAFVDNECRGVSTVSYVPSLNRYIAFLTIYGNSANEVINFKIFWGNSEKIYDNLNPEYFENNAIKGTPSDPYKWYIYEYPTEGTNTLINGCIGSSYNITANEGAVKYEWNTGETTQTISVNQSNTYTCIRELENNTRIIDSWEVSLHNMPVVDLGHDTDICSENMIVLDAGNEGSEYLWNTGETTSEIVINTTGRYSVEVTSEYGCISTDAVIFNIFDIPEVDLGENVTICSDSNITLDAGNEGSSFLWNTGETTREILVNTAGKYSVEVVSKNGCIGTDEVIISVSAIPEIHLGEDVVICSGSAVTLDVGFGDSNYLWNTGETSREIVVNTAGKYSVEVTSVYGCTGNDDINVSISSNPEVNLGNDTLICSGSIVTLDAGNEGSDYKWNTGETNREIVINTSGRYSVEVKSVDGCIGSDEVIVNVSSMSEVDLGNDTIICAGSAIRLDAGNGASDYLWNTGETSQEIVVNKSGKYSVEVKSAFGCVGFDEINITASSIPEVNLGDDVIICSGSTVTLDAGNEGSDFLWNNGETNREIVVNKIGIYSVEVISEYGCIENDEILVTISPIPVVDLGNDTIICSGSTVTLEAGDNALGYLWNTGDTTREIVVNKKGNYSVDVTSEYGCIGTDNITVSTSAIPKVDLGNDTIICSGSTITLDAKNEDFNYLWNTGEYTHQIAVDTNGSYSVEVISEYGCIGTDEILVSTSDIPKVDLGNDTIICGENILLLDAGNIGSSYLWNTGQTTKVITAFNAGKYSVIVTNPDNCSVKDEINIEKAEEDLFEKNMYLCKGDTLLIDALFENASSYIWDTGENTSQIYTSDGGSKDVKITLSDGCIVNGTFLVNFNSTPVIDIPESIVACEDEMITLDAKNTGAKYSWSTGDTTQVLNLGINGVYSVEVTNSNGCKSTKEIEVDFKSPPTFSFQNDYIQTCYNNLVNLDAQLEGMTYLWSTGDTTKTIIPFETGNYSLEITNEWGCKTSDQILVLIEPYELSFINKTLLNGETYFFERISLSQSGVYFINDSSYSCTRGIVLNLVTTSSTNSFGELAGFLEYDKANQLGGAIVLLRSKDKLTTIATQTLSDGQFSFENLEPGNYLLCAVVGHLNLPGNPADCYYNDSYNWENATDIVIQESQTSVITFALNSEILPEGRPTNINDLHSIFGNVIYNDSLNEEIGIYLAPKDQISPQPLQRLTRMVLFKYVNNTKVFFKSALTNDKGEYAFQNIPPGDYSVEVDLPGKVQHELEIVRFNENDSSRIVNFRIIIDKLVPAVYLNVDTRVKIYPNPCDNVLFIEQKNFGSPFIIKIFNLTGQCIMQKKLFGFHNQIDIDFLNQGVFLMEINYKNQRFQHTKIMVD